MYKKYIKRFLDILLSLSVLILFSPLLLLTAILVRIKLGAPVLFSQERPGYRGKIFRIYKFRSMSDKRNAEGELLPDEERLTSFGKLLRASSLDELPEMFNILRGEKRPKLGGEVSTGRFLCRSSVFFAGPEDPAFHREESVYQGRRPVGGRPDHD